MDALIPYWTSEAQTGCTAWVQYRCTVTSMEVREEAEAGGSGRGRVGSTPPFLWAMPPPDTLPPCTTSTDQSTAHASMIRVPQF